MVVLLVVVVSSIAGGGGGAAEAGAGDAGYSASFSAICNQAKAGWDLVGDYQFSGGTTPPGAILGGECARTPSRPRRCGRVCTAFTHLQRRSAERGSTTSTA